SLKSWSPAWRRYTCEKHHKSRCDIAAHWRLQTCTALYRVLVQRFVQLIDDQRPWRIRGELLGKKLTLCIVPVRRLGKADFGGQLVLPDEVGNPLLTCIQPQL